MTKKVLIFFVSILAVLLPLFTFDTVADAAAKPEVVISNYYLDENFEFGKETTLHIEVTNMSNVYAVEGVLITYTSANNTVIPALGKTNQVYVTSISTNQTAEVEIPIVLVNSEVGYGQVSFAIEYTVADTEVFTNNSYIVFPLSDNGDIEINNVNVATKANYGAKSLVGLNYTNIGDSVIRDVKLVVSGDVQNGRVETQIGDVAAGRTGYFESYVVYENVGVNNISVSLVYEDVDGQVFVTDGGDFTIMVEEAADKVLDQNDVTDDFDATGDQMDDVSNQNLSILFLGLAGLIVIALIIMVVVQVITKKRQ